MKAINRVGRSIITGKKIFSTLFGFVSKLTFVDIFFEAQKGQNGDASGAGPAKRRERKEIPNCGRPRTQPV